MERIGGQIIEFYKFTKSEKLTFLSNGYYLKTKIFSSEKLPAFIKGGLIIFLQI
jgi:hypothetical protein